MTIRTMRGWVGLAALVMVGIGSACVPVFDNPLPVSPEMTADAALVGTWSGINGDDGGSQLSIYPRRSGWLDILFVTDLDGASDDGVRVQHYDGYTTAIDQDRLLCLREHGVRGGDVSTNGYLLASYRVAPSGQLNIQLFAQAEVRKLIEAGKLKGTIQDDQYGGSIRVTTPSERLLTTIVTEGVSAFVSSNEVMSFRKLQVPAEPAPSDP